MIQLPALASQSSAAPAADAPLGQVGESTESTAFGALLAAREAAAPTLAAPASLLADLGLQADQPTAIPATDHAAVPDSGKILPDGLLPQLSAPQVTQLPATLIAARSNRNQPEQLAAQPNLLAKVQANASRAQVSAGMASGQPAKHPAATAITAWDGEPDANDDPTENALTIAASPAHATPPAPAQLPLSSTAPANAAPYFDPTSDAAHPPAPRTATARTAPIAPLPQAAVVPAATPLVTATPASPQALVQTLAQTLGPTLAPTVPPSSLQPALAAPPSLPQVPDRAATPAPTMPGTLVSATLLAPSPNPRLPIALAPPQTLAEPLTPASAAAPQPVSQPAPQPSLQPSGPGDPTVASALHVAKQPERAATPAAMTATADDAALTLAPPLAPTASVAEPLTRASIAPSALRPHDFAALVDSLVAAREAARPQAAAIAINHSEFGPIHLRFNQDDGGLSVSMASADPGFARAASLAMPPVATAPASGMLSSESGGQQPQQQAGQPNSQNPSRPHADAGGSPHGSGTGQGRAAPPPRSRDDEPGGAGQPRRPPDPGSTRHGIFA